VLERGQAGVGMEELRPEVEKLGVRMEELRPDGEKLGV
jgi:hypothetical protein